MKFVITIAAVLTASPVIAQSAKTVRIAQNDCRHASLSVSDRIECYRASPTGDVASPASRNAGADGVSSTSAAGGVSGGSPTPADGFSTPFTGGGGSPAASGGNADKPN